MAIDVIARKANRGIETAVECLAATLAFFGFPVRSLLEGTGDADTGTIQSAVAERLAALNAKDFKKADEIRAALLAEGNSADGRQERQGRARHDLGGEAMTPIVDHVGLRVTDFQRARAFYNAALGTLGIQLLADFEHAGKRHAGYGSNSGPSFWIDEGKTSLGDAHVAFAAHSRAEVKAFYTAALANGGRNNGLPGVRPHYHPDYFAAYVLDPDGHNIEAVHVGPDQSHA